MKKLILILAVTAASFLLQACSSVPVSSMIKMASFDEQDFNEIDPHYIRVKLRTDKPVDVDNDSITLKFAFKSAETNFEEPLTLRVIDKSQKTIERWIGSNAQEYTATFALDQASVVTFNKIKQLPVMSQRRSEADVDFSATVDFGDNIPEQFIMSVDLLLDPLQGFITLIDEYEFDIEEIAKQSESQTKK